MNQYNPYQGIPENGYAPYAPSKDQPRTDQDDLKGRAEKTQTRESASWGLTPLQQSRPSQSDSRPAQTLFWDVPREVPHADDPDLLSSAKTIEEISASILSNPSVLIRQAVSRKENLPLEQKEKSSLSPYDSIRRTVEKQSARAASPLYNALPAHMKSSAGETENANLPASPLQNAPSEKSGDQTDAVVNTEQTQPHAKNFASEHTKFPYGATTGKKQPANPAHRPDAAKNAARRTAAVKAPLPTGPLQGFVWANGKSESDVAGTDVSQFDDQPPDRTRKELHPSAGTVGAGLPVKISPSEPIAQPKRPAHDVKENSLDRSPLLFDTPAARPDSADGTVDSASPYSPYHRAPHGNPAALTRGKEGRRTIHSKGYGAFGVFYPYRSMREYTCADFLQSPDKFTPVLVRFSLATGDQNTPDTSRNVRGFCVRFYTEEGVFDLLCSHIPVFFTQDPSEFPEALAAFSSSLKSNPPDPTDFWSFIADHPQSMHMLTYLYSDQGTVDSFRHMQGHSVNAHLWKNAQGKRSYVKYTWLPLSGVNYTDANSARILSDAQPNAAGKDLYDSIQNGIPVEYELFVQLIPVEEADDLQFHPLDVTKIWSRREFPLIQVGKLSLIQNSDDDNAQAENAAFSPVQLVPGIERSDDYLFQGRSELYEQASRFRSGETFTELPENRCSGRPPRALLAAGGFETSGQRTRQSDDFSQPRARYERMTPDQKKRLSENIAADLKNAPLHLQARVLSLLKQVSPEYAAQVRNRLNA